jgi:hypothetical protein
VPQRPQLHGLCVLHGLLHHLSPTRQQIQPLQGLGGVCVWGVCITQQDGLFR